MSVCVFIHACVHIYVRVSVQMHAHICESPKVEAEFFLDCSSPYTQRQVLSVEPRMC